MFPLEEGDEATAPRHSGRLLDNKDLDENNISELERDQDLKCLLKNKPLSLNTGKNVIFILSFNEIRLNF